VIHVIPAMLLAFQPLLSDSDREDTNIMADRIDVIKYSIQMRIEDQDSLVNATTEIEFKVLADIQELQFNLKEMNVVGCSLDGEPVAFEHKNGVLMFVTHPTLRPGTTYRLSVDYSGRPKDGLIIGRNKYHHFSVFSDNWPNRARFWFPCIDHPSDKAAVSFHITVPMMYQVIANGTLVGIQASTDKEATYEFDMGTPTPTYCMVIGVCRFALTETKTRSGIPIYSYSFPEDSTAAVRGFARVPDMVQYYDSLIGPYPFSKLALVQSSTMFGGMENSSAVFLPENSLSYSDSVDNELTVSHELAHQWFGDDVTVSNWPDLWLSEGFATYFSMLYFESRKGEQYFKELIAGTRNYYEQSSTKVLPLIDTTYSNVSDLLNVENYDKGALLLHALRGYLGDEAFFNGMKEYFRRFSHKNATTSDFKNVMTLVSKKDVSEFFQKWLCKPGLPE
jgi:aminopeptidase N